MSQILLAMEPLKDRIIRHLRMDTRLKDDDKLLFKSIWKEDILSSGMDITIMNAAALMDLFIDGKLSNTESVRRMRQKVQEEDPAMRGEKYGERHKNGKGVKETINSPERLAELRKPKHTPKFSI